MTSKKKVTTIPATLIRFDASPVDTKQRRRVAGYARVSTDHDEQFTSYTAQIDYYTNYICSRDDWEFVGVYTDEGITGTSTKHREGFKSMIVDALSGKIDLIVTKSVSRFARNTVDSLTTIRKLKENSVEVYFEKENIWTFDGKGELLLTIMSSLAQEESRSISENCTWGQRKRFADGKASVGYGRFLGYDRGPDGNLVVNHEQALIVQRIYAEFLQGANPYTIAKKLTREGIPTPGGKEKWSDSTVRSILTNEKYKGDALLQKSYTVDFLSKKRKVNEGEIPQYYVEDNHEAIISKEVFDMVQRELLRRKGNKNYHSSVHTFSSAIKCGQCGSWYGSKVWHSNSKYRKTIWQCNHKFDNEIHCTTPHLSDDNIEKAFLSAANKLLSAKGEVIRNAYEMVDLFFNTSKLEKQQTILLNETQLISESVQQMIYENAHTALDQTDYRKRYDSLTEQFDATKERLETVTVELERKQMQRADIESFLKSFEELPDILTEFSAENWNALVDYVTVYSIDDIRITFKHGQEVRA